MATRERYFTARQAREDYGFSESGWRDAWRNGRVPAPVIIGGKYLWAESRMQAFEQEMLAQAAAREAALKAANSPAARQAAAIADSQHGRDLLALSDHPAVTTARRAGEAHQRRNAR